MSKIINELINASRYAAKIREDIQESRFSTIYPISHQLVAELKLIRKILFSEKEEALQKFARNSVFDELINYVENEVTVEDTLKDDMIELYLDDYKNNLKPLIERLLELLANILTQLERKTGFIEIYREYYISRKGILKAPLKHAIDIREQELKDAVIEDTINPPLFTVKGRKKFISILNEPFQKYQLLIIAQPGMITFEAIRKRLDRSDKLEVRNEILAGWENDFSRRQKLMLSKHYLEIIHKPGGHLWIQFIGNPAHHKGSATSSTPGARAYNAKANDIIKLAES